MTGVATPAGGPLPHMGRDDHVPGIIFAAVLAITGAMPTMNAHDHQRYRRE